MKHCLQCYMCEKDECVDMYLSYLVWILLGFVIFPSLSWSKYYLVNNFVQLNFPTLVHMLMQTNTQIQWLICISKDAMCSALVGFEELCSSVPPPQQNSVWNTVWSGSPPPLHVSHKNMTFLTMCTNILTFPRGGNIDRSSKTINKLLTEGRERQKC
jgi:hypothetical protein